MAKEVVKKEVVKTEKLAKGVLKKGSKTLNEFKAFIARGNVIDLAVGVIIGNAFGKIVTSIVNDILMPLIGVVIGGLDFSALSFQIKDATISYGLFIQNIVDFLIVAACIFVMIKVINRLTHKVEHTEEVTEEVVEPPKDEQVVLLEEIRDLLKNQKETKKSPRK